LAAMPDGQRADGVTSEAVEAYWATPQRALQDWAEGKCQLLPPTHVTLTEVAGHDSLASSLRAERELVKNLPKMTKPGGRWRAARRRGALGGGGGLLRDSAAGAAGLGGEQVPAAPADPRDVDRGGRPRQPGQLLARGAGTGEDPAEDDQAGRQVADSAPRGAG